MDFKLLFKKSFRKVYYFFRHGKVVFLHKPDTLSGSKWIIDESYGRSYFKGYYEPQLTDYLLNNLKENSVFFDIGAHAGYFSLLAARKCINGYVYSFEPYPKNISFIKRIQNLNSISNWELIPAAISDITGSASFSEGMTSSTGKLTGISEKSNLVPTKSIDSFIKEHIIYPDLIKIDVEGHADKVLRGFKKLNEYNKDLVLIIEIHDNSNELKYIKENFNDKYLITDLKNSELNLSNNNLPNHLVIQIRK